MRDMSEAERREFLSTGHRTAKVATVRPDGSPHVAPVWFVLDGDEIVFTTFHNTAKAANLRENDHIAICVDDEEPPFAYVIIEGQAKLDPHAPDLLSYTTRLAGRYMGADQAEAFGRRNAVEGEILVRVKPSKIIAKTNIAD